MPGSPNPGSALNALAEGFQDTIVVVVGGRGSIGSEVVSQVRALGGRVIIGSSSPDLPGFEPDAWSSSGVAVLPCNLKDPASIAAFAASIGEIAGRIDILVTTAGSSVQLPLKKLELLSDELIDDVFQTNAIGLLRLIRECTPLLKAGQDPVIVNVGSVAAMTGLGSNLAYVGAKASVDAMFKGLAKALAPTVRLVTIAPSALETDFVKGRGADFIEKTIAATPLGRLASVQEVASAVLCAARVLTSTTGSVITVDGGRHL